MKLIRNAVCGGQQGASYIEILVATALIAISLIPASEALRSATASSSIYSDYSVQNYRLLAKMEEVLARSYFSLETEAAAVGSETIPTIFSDAVATPDRRLVYLSPYDADNADADNDPFTGTDPDLIWVRVQIEDSALVLESLTAL